MAFFCFHLCPQNYIISHCFIQSLFLCFYTLRKPALKFQLHFIDYINIIASPFFIFSPFFSFFLNPHLFLSLKSIFPFYLHLKINSFENLSPILLLWFILLLFLIRLLYLSDILFLWPCVLIKVQPMVLTNQLYYLSYWTQWHSISHSNANLVKVSVCLKAIIHVWFCYVTKGPWPTLPPLNGRRIESMELWPSFWKFQPKETYIMSTQIPFLKMWCSHTMILERWKISEVTFWFYGKKTYFVESSLPVFSCPFYLCMHICRFVSLCLR